LIITPERIRNSPGNPESTGNPIFAIENKNQNNVKLGIFSDNPDIFELSLHPVIL
jgi:hypothetical protein